MPDSPSYDPYWASKSGLELASDCWKRVKGYYNDLVNTVMYQRWAKAYRVFYGLSGGADPFDISKAAVVGEKGQLTSIRINHAGSLARRAVTLVSQTVPEFEPVATNDDYESFAQQQAARKFLDYCMDTRGVGARLYETAGGAVIFGESSIEVGWDPLAGQPLKTPDPTQPKRTKTGDLTFRVFTPLDVIIDRLRYDQDHDWKITRRFVNRWDLAARHPALGDRIVGMKADPFPAAMTPSNSLEWEKSHNQRDIHRDLVPLYTLYHRQTDAIQQGKFATFLSGDILLAEGNLPYEEVPLVSICPGRILRTPYGESLLHHILALQEVRDNLASAVASNNVAFGTQIVMMPDETEWSIKELSEGLAVLKYSSGPNGKEPKGLSLTAPNKEALEFMRLLREEMELIWGINSTSRGQPGNNVRSGEFGALLAQQALEYAGQFQYAFQQAVAQTGNLIVSIVKQFADQPIVAEIAGKAHGYQVEEFSKAKFDRIHRVTVKSGNPAARTPQFAMAMADSLLQRGLIKTPQEYIALARSGDIDTMIDADETQLLNIRRENEMLRQGKRVPVVATDAHKEHILEHKAVLDDPSARDKQDIAVVALAHIQGHIDALRNTDPALLMLLGQQPLPPLPAPGGPGAPIAPTTASPPGPGPQGQPGEQPGPAPAPPDVGGPGALPEPSGLPDNPLTGSTWTPQDGAFSS